MHSADQFATHENALSEPIQSFLSLFSTELADLRFPGADPETLEQQREQVLAAAQAVADAEQTLADAKSELESMQASLLKLAQRAHAYASIYAEDNPELEERLKQIRLGGPKRAPRKKEKTVGSTTKEKKSKGSPLPGKKKEPVKPGEAVFSEPDSESTGAHVAA